jgi:hypothetical protein
MRYKVFDWAGNDLSDYYGTFSSFEEAWEAIYKRLENEENPEEYYQEYQVLQTLSDSPKKHAWAVGDKMPRWGNV